MRGYSDSFDMATIPDDVLLSEVQRRRGKKGGAVPREQRGPARKHFPEALLPAGRTWALCVECTRVWPCPAEYKRRSRERQKELAAPA